MTKEEKELLLKDISFRLTNKVCCSFSFDNDTHVVTGVWGDGIRITGKDYTKTNKPQVKMWVDIKNIKLYLRPMSSMTREEEAYWNYHRHMVGDGVFSLGYDNPTFCIFECFEWLNSHHFDYGGLIIKGLALEAPEGMYKFD